MTITINLSAATLDQLKAEAQASGKDVETVVREVVEARFTQQTFAEILKPVHDEVEASGMSEEEITALAEKAVAQARAMRKASRKP
jgi:hypothetical protein